MIKNKFKFHKNYKFLHDELEHKFTHPELSLKRYVD